MKVIDLTPRIGSEIKTDLGALLSGRDAEQIRATLEQRGVVYFRGLSITDEQQVAIARTLGNTVASEGKDGIYKVSLDRNVNARADYLKGSQFWHRSEEHTSELQSLMRTSYAVFCLNI